MKGLINMKDNKWIFLSALLLSCSIVFSSIYLGNSIKTTSTPVNTEPVETKISSPDLLTKEEAAAYLNLSDTMFNLILKNEEEDKSGRRSYPTHKYIHSLNLYGQEYFSIKQLDQWIEYHLYNEF
ncbi:hypothetical protein [Oceanirhabdus sp. W0125-5]|uniref:hypothetical protein n=1 Tax=Oceanirhabdus sp. W0125-5 TaxID=2999116 RepID=UPI0022F3237F|nr:hypothetical protein [Oceanirhabdus sp. W0125-5]WBW97294.1 hypothetical protein OW730_00120 [Oceanirhabdus sp. W0125-5]